LSREPTTVFIGRKPVMNYVLAVISIFSGGNKEVTLKARGRAITTAVDVAEITKHRFMESLSVSKIQIGTEQLEMQEGGTRAVSTVEITLTTEARPKEEAEATQEVPAPAT